MTTLRLTPLTRDIECVRGTLRAFTVVCEVDDAPYDLTGKTLTLTVKTSPLASGAEVYALDVTSHTDPTNGETEVTIPASATFGTDGGTSTYVYELRVLPEGLLFFAGAFTVLPTGAPV